MSTMPETPKPAELVKQPFVEVKKMSVAMLAERLKLIFGSPVEVTCLPSSEQEKQTSGQDF